MQYKVYSLIIQNGGFIDKALKSLTELERDNVDKIVKRYLERVLSYRATRLKL